MNTRPKRNVKPSLILKDFIVLSDQDKFSKFKFDSANCSTIENGITIVEKKGLNEDVSNTVNKSFCCTKCPLKFSHKTDLKLHNKSHKNVNTYLCEDCGKSLSTLQSFTEHVNIHKNVKPFKCEYCEHESRQFSVHYRHLLTHNEDPSSSYKCSICHKSFKLKEYLKRHVVKHLNKVVSDKNLHKCDKCTKTFTEKRDLKRHKVSHSSIKHFSCDYCRKGFKMKHNLQAHLKIHSGLQTWKCNQCSSQFPQQSFLEVHKKSHKELIQNIELVKADNQTIHVTTFPLDKRKVSQYQKLNLPKDFSLDNEDTLNKSKLSLCLNDVVFPLSVVAKSFGTGTHVKVKIIDALPTTSEKLKISNKPVFKAYIAEKEFPFQEGLLNNGSSEQTGFNLTQEQNKPPNLLNDAKIECNQEYEFEMKIKAFEKNFALVQDDCIKDLEEITTYIQSNNESLNQPECIMLQKIISILQIHFVKFSFTENNEISSNHTGTQVPNGSETLEKDELKLHKMKEDKTGAMKKENSDDEDSDTYSKQTIKRFKECYNCLIDALHNQFKMASL